MRATCRCATSTATTFGRLTSDEGVESSPSSRPTARRSPSAPNTTATSTSTSCRFPADVPTRLTWHPGADVVQGFTPDGKSVLFTSPRAVFTGRYTQLFTVPVERRHRGRAADSERARGDVTRRTARASPTTRSARASNSGSAIAAAPPRRSRCTTREARMPPRRSPQPAARANDVDPMWLGDTRVLPVRSRRRVQPLRASTRSSEASAAAHEAR